MEVGVLVKLMLPLLILSVRLFTCSVKHFGQQLCMKPIKLLTRIVIHMLYRLFLSGRHCKTGLILSALSNLNAGGLNVFRNCEYSCWVAQYAESNRWRHHLPSPLCFLKCFSATLFLPGTTGRSSTPSAIVSGWSKAAPEGWGEAAELVSDTAIKPASALSPVSYMKMGFYRLLRYLSLLQSLCEAIFRHTFRLSSELKRGMPKHSSRGTHSSSDERTGR